MKIYPVVALFVNSVLYFCEGSLIVCPTFLELISHFWQNQLCVLNQFARLKINHVSIFAARTNNKVSCTCWLHQFLQVCVRWKKITTNIKISFQFTRLKCNSTITFTCLFKQHGCLSPRCIFMLLNFWNDATLSDKFFDAV